MAGPPPSTIRRISNPNTIRYPSCPSNTSGLRYCFSTRYRKGSPDSSTSHDKGPLLETLSTIASDDRNGSKSPIAPGNHSKVEISDLKILSCICQGQFTIYHAIDRNSHIQVALKKTAALLDEDDAPHATKNSVSSLEDGASMHRSLSSTARSVTMLTHGERCQYLEQEISILRQLAPHPNVVRLLGYQLPYALATQFCIGGNLLHRLHDRPKKFKMTGKEAMHLTKHFCSALIHIHSHGIVHRDLKSGNLLLDKGSADLTQDTLIVCDFGLSAKEGDEWREAGTLRYAAPEVVIEKATASLYADIWAFGCVLVELFGGELPYSECDGVGQIMAQIVVDQTGPEIPEKLLESSTKFRQIIIDTLLREPTERPLMHEIMSRLQEI